MKPGRVVILLAGRHAGKKAIIVKQHDDGKKVRSHLVDSGVGQEIRSRFGGRYREKSTESNQKNELKENREKIQGQAFR